MISRECLTCGAVAEYDDGNEPYPTQRYERKTRAYTLSQDKGFIIVEDWTIGCGCPHRSGTVMTLQLNDVGGREIHATYGAHLAPASS